MIFSGTNTIGFMGCGNMAQAIIKGLIDNKVIPAQKIFISNRSQGKLLKLRDQFGVNPVNSNEELVEKSQVVVLAMKPQDLLAAIDPMGGIFQEKQIVISLAAGVKLNTLKKHLPLCRWIRLMPNTPTLIGQGLVGYYTDQTDSYLDTLVEDLFKPLGQCSKLKDEEQFESFMVACSSGIGFVYEMMIYWQDWMIEYGFEEEVAQNLTLQTFLGASLLAKGSPHLTLEELQTRVASKKGVTEAGLQSMRDSEIERSLRVAFEKAGLRNQEMAKLLK
ncbi:MAG: pyrroline-5-carboxylate reductase [Bdellovibrionaceae bacterium]|nr:pyrroline-5-carboxylate reductase [Pseudobdellovibrionaceae bacterium]